MSVPKGQSENKGIDQVQHGRVALKVLGGIMGLGLLALAVLATDVPSVADFTRTLGVCALTAGAFAFLGALLGFVFGIPRTAEPVTVEKVHGQQGDRAAIRSSQVEFRHNTNLEDISDWLTKILVGVGLTQLTALPEHIWALASTIAPGLGSGDHIQVLALATIIFYAATGFLFSYLWTRLYLKGALVQADALLSLERKVETTVSRLKLQSSKDAKALNLATLYLNPGTESTEIDVNAMKEAIKQSSSAVKTTVYHQAWKVRSEFWDKDKARMARSIPIFEALVESDRNDEYHQNHGQLGWALKDMEPPDCVRAERELTKAISMRGDWRKHGWLFYEAARAECRIQLQKDAKHASRVSSEDILADLRVVAHLRDEDNYTLRSPVVLEWLKKEDLTVDALRRDLQ